MGHLFRELLPLVIIGGGFALTGAVLYGAWLLGRYRGRDDEMPNEFARVEIRLQRLEVAIAQTTDALDRLEAAQRLAARILTELPASATRPALRQVTPH